MINPSNIHQFNKELLTEAIQKNRIISAIRNNYVIKIYYDSDEDDDVLPGYRTIEPFCYGSGNGGLKNLPSNREYIRAWLRNDWSNTLNKTNKRRDKVRWRLFRVDKIVSFNNIVNKKTFDSSKEFISQFRPYYNPNDKDLNVIYSIGRDI